MVAVRDRDRRASNSLRDRFQTGLRPIGRRHDPQSMSHLVAVRQVGGGCRSGRHIVKPARDRPRGILVETDDGTRVHVRRAQETVAVLLRAGHRPLVRPHPGARAEWLEDKAREDAASDQRLAA